MQFYDAKHSLLFNLITTVWGLYLCLFYLYVSALSKLILVNAYSGTHLPLTSKPLVNLLDYYNINISYPLSGTVALLYYHLFGRIIVRKLDAVALNCQPLKSVPNRQTTVRRQFTSCLLFHQLLSITNYGTFFYYILFEKEDLICKKILSLVYYYLLFNNLVLSMFIAHYLHYSTYCQLREIVNFNQSAFQTETLLMPFRQTIQQLKNLSSANKTARLWYSFPLGCTYLLANFVDIIICLVFVGINFDIGNLIYIVAFFVYQFYLAHLNSQIESALQKIGAQYCKIKLIQKIENCDSRQTAEEVNSVICASQLSSVYGHLLQVRIFSLVTVNYSFVVKMVLTALYYSLLLSQTNQL